MNQEVTRVLIENLAKNEVKRNPVVQSVVKILGHFKTQIMGNEVSFSFTHDYAKAYPLQLKAMILTQAMY